MRFSFAAALLAFCFRAFGEVGLSADYVRMRPSSPPVVCNNGDLRVASNDSNRLKVCQANTWVPMIDTSWGQTASVTFGSVTATNFTGAFTGTASFAATSGTASFAATSGTASYAGTASFSTASSTASVSGLADIAKVSTAFSTTPSGCAAGQYAHHISPSGNLTCSQVSFTEIGGTASISQGGTGQGTKSAAFDALSPMTASGDIIYGGASGTGTRLGKGSDGDILMLVSGLPAWTAAAAGSAVNYKNYAQNAGFRFWQRAAALTSTDDNYGPDRWYALSSGATGVGFIRTAEVVTGSPSQFAAQIRQETVASHQYGIAQILEYARVVELRGKQVSLVFQARTDGTEVTTLRACLGEWTGTADSVTSDVVATWAATPTWIGSFACANTPADLTISSSWAQVTATATLGTTFNNLVLVVWTPNAEAENDDFYMTQVQLLQGSAGLSWDKVAKSYDQDLAEVRRFYEKSYDVDTDPGAATGIGAHCFATSNDAATNFRDSVRYFVEKRAVPTVNFWDLAGTGTAYTSYDAAAAGTNGRTASASIVNNSKSGHAFNGSHQAFSYCVHWVANAEL